MNMFKNINWSLVSSVLCVLVFFATCSRPSTSDMKKMETRYEQRIDSLSKAVLESQKAIANIQMEYGSQASGYFASGVMGSKENAERTSIARQCIATGKENIGKLK